jgi:O-antigen ligase
MVKILLIIIILFLPLQFALNIGSDFDLVVTRVLIPVLFILWLARGMARKKIWIPNRFETWLILIFLALSGASLVLGRDASEGARKLLYFLSIFPVYFVAADVFWDEKWKKRGILAIFLSGTLAAVIAIIQFSLPYFLGVGKAVKIWESIAPHFLGNSFSALVAANSSWLVNLGGVTRMRAFGFFPDPHNFAFFVNLCIFVGLGIWFSPRKNISRVWLQLGLVLMLLSVMLSFSRGAYLGLIAGIIFFAFVSLKRSGVLGKAAAGLGLALVLIFIFSPTSISSRLSSSFNLREGSNVERLKNWTQAVSVIQNYPIGGVGLGNYSREIAPTAPDRSSIYAHNLFLDIAAETGILNAIVFLILILVSVWRNLKSRDMVGLGAAAGLVAYLVHSLFDTALYSPQVLVILLILIAIDTTDNSKFKDQNSK